MTPMTGVRCAFVRDGLDEANIREAQQATHDLLIADLGATRTSGVRWHHYFADEGASILRRLERNLGMPTDPTMMRLLDTTPGALLVVAMADYEDRPVARA